MSRGVLVSAAVEALYSRDAPRGIADPGIGTSSATPSALDVSIRLLDSSRGNRP